MANRTALITGGTGGIGKAIATELARKNYTMFFVGETSIGPIKPLPNFVR